jgi:signal transduction histidine kinase
MTVSEAQPVRDRRGWGRAASASAWSSKRPWLSAPFGIGSTAALVLVGCLALLGIVAMTFWLGERAGHYYKQAIEARDARAAATELRHALESAESSQRGFLLTGNQIYLAPFGTSKELAQRQLEQIRAVLKADASSRALLDRLSSIVTEKFAEMDRSIALKRERSDAEALAIIRTNRGKALMDEANVFITSLVRRADDQLTREAGEQTGNARLLRWSILAGAGLIVLVSLAVATTVVRHTRDMAEAQREIVALNSGLEQRVEERTSALAQANEEIQRFAYVVTHDLRAPLVNIVGFTGEIEIALAQLRPLAGASSESDPQTVAARHAVNRDIPEAIGFIRSSTQRMDNLIKAILKLSREGKRNLRPDRIALQPLISDTIGSMRHVLEEAGGRVEIDCRVDSIVSDRLSVEQIVGNILDNAIKYRSPARAPQILIRAAPFGARHVVIDISDNGRGIAEQDRERVFELFRRAGAQDQPGEGIGLAHVRMLVRNLGGQVSFTSSLDQGTRFRVILPLELTDEKGSA